MAKRIRFRPSLRRLRTWCAVAAAVLFVVIMVSAHWELGAYYAGGPLGKDHDVGVRLESGAVEIVWNWNVNPADVPAPTGLGFTADRTWTDDITVAWRPYHVATQPWFSGSSDRHGFVFPLWLVAVPVTIAAAYLQGVVSGMKRADKGRCAGCGYSRAGLAADAACPECGKAGLPHGHKEPGMNETDMHATDSRR